MILDEIEGLDVSFCDRYGWMDAGRFSRAAHREWCTVKGPGLSWIEVRQKAVCLEVGEIVGEESLVWALDCCG
jgi:hypothetical protein